MKERVDCHKRTTKQKLDDLILTVAEMENKHRAQITALAQEVHNMRHLNTQYSGENLNRMIRDVEKEMQRLLMGLAERMDALTPRDSWVKRLLHVLHLRRK